MKLAVSLATSIATIGLASTVTAPAGAFAVVFDNFGPNDAYDTEEGWIISGSSSIVSSFTQGFQFFPTATGELAKIEVAIGLVGESSNEVLFELRKDTGANSPDLTPAGLLESFNFLNQMEDFGDLNPPLVGLSTLEPILSSSTPYWLIANTPNSDTLSAWNLNFSGDTGSRYFNGNILFDDPRGAFRITVRDVAAVPEPITILGSATALGLGALLKRKLKSSKSPKKETEKIS
jgi:hypothetical protein